MSFLDTELYRLSRRFNKSRRNIEPDTSRTIAGNNTRYKYIDWYTADGIIAILNQRKKLGIKLTEEDQQLLQISLDAQLNKSKIYKRDIPGNNMKVEANGLTSWNHSKPSHRKSWDSYFMNIAKSVAERSTCDRLSVGCVIVKDNRIVSTGYNGSVSGNEHCDDIGHLMVNGRCVRTVHAEQNALLFAKESLYKSTAYVTHEPCETCLKLLVQAGVTRIRYLNEYHNEATEKLKREFIFKCDISKYEG